MDPLISDLVDRYERGRLSRRDLIAGLSALAAGGAAAAGSAAHGQEAAPIVPQGLDHVSILTADLQRSVEFYGRVFGLQNISEDVENKIVRLGIPGGPAFPGGVLVSLRQGEPAGVVDHWAFSIEGFERERARSDLARHGLTAEESLEYGFHVRDPDGVVVQLL